MLRFSPTIAAFLVFTSGRNLSSILHKMQDSINTLVQWCNLNGFKISMNKTVAVLFTRRIDRIDSILKIIKVENKAKFLGKILIQNYLGTIMLTIS